MRVKRLSILFLFFFFFASLSSATAQGESGGFMDGNGFWDLPEVLQTFYVMGLIDGMALAPKFGAPWSEMNKLYGLGNKGISGEQFCAIAKKYIEDHPEQRHRSMPGLVYEALVRAFHWPK